jgi:hypothetical protein
VTLVQGELRRGVLREDGERAAVVLEVVDHEPIMRNEVLDALRERRQEAPGVEAILHRPADGLDRREEIGEERLVRHLLSLPEHGVDPRR